MWRVIKVNHISRDLHICVFILGYDVIFLAGREVKRVWIWLSWTIHIYFQLIYRPEPSITANNNRLSCGPKIFSKIYWQFLFRGRFKDVSFLSFFIHAFLSSLCTLSSLEMGSLLIDSVVLCFLKCTAFGFFEGHCKKPAFYALPLHFL